nr:hypothetical protein [Tanacetum cinerariifolium]
NGISAMVIENKVKTLTITTFLFPAKKVLRAITFPNIMSSSTHHITIPSDYEMEDAFSSTHSPDYILASPNYFQASSGNTSPDPSEDLSKYLLALLSISPFHNDLYIKDVQAFYAKESPIPLPTPITPATILTPSPDLHHRLGQLHHHLMSYLSGRGMKQLGTPAMTQAAIKKLVADSVSAALKAQAANIAYTVNTSRPREAHVARKCSYKEFMS